MAKSKNGAGRENKICVRVGDDLFASLSLAASERGLTRTALCKEIIEKNGKLPRPFFNREDASKILIELTRVGVNLNQVAKKLNQDGTVDDVFYRANRDTYNIVLWLKKMISNVISM